MLYYCEVLPQWAVFSKLSDLLEVLTLFLKSSINKADGSFKEGLYEVQSQEILFRINVDSNYRCCQSYLTRTMFKWSPAWIPYWLSLPVRYQMTWWAQSQQELPDSEESSSYLQDINARSPNNQSSIFLHSAPVYQVHLSLGDRPPILEHSPSRYLLSLLLWDAAGTFWLVVCI